MRQVSNEELRSIGLRILFVLALSVAAFGLGTVIGKQYSEEYKKELAERAAMDERERDTTKLIDEEIKSISKSINEIEKANK
jgi:hypothetical protein